MHNGSEQKLAKLHRQFRPALVSFFRRRLGSHAEAEDLTQEVFIRLANADLAAVESPDAFVFRIATNLVRDRSRRDRVRADYRAAVEQIEGVGIDPLDPYRVASARDLLGRLWAAIQALPEPTQQIFILYRIENLDKQVIADNYGIAVRTVEKHITHAMVFLKKRIGGRP